MDTSGKPSSASSQAGGTLARAVDTASSGVHHAIDSVAGSVGPALDRLASGAHQALDKIADSAGQAATTLGDNGDHLMHAQERAMAQCRGYVRENPVISLGIAIGAGILLGRLLGSR
jgi:ElaB/YqjD/DUF883 family membrane-anchored ribosome-binding protein